MFARRSKRTTFAAAACYGNARIAPHLDVYRYWDRKRGDRVAVTRRDIDPTEIGSLLRHLALVAPSQGGYRWRLMGTGIVADIGIDLTGQQFGEHIGSGAFVRAVTATFDRVLTLSEPIFEDSLYQTDGGGRKAVSRLLSAVGEGR
jgi:hypothetical protein